MWRSETLYNRPDQIPGRDINYDSSIATACDRATARVCTRRSRARDTLTRRYKFPGIVTAPNPREGSEAFGSQRHDQRGETIDGHDPGYGWKTGSGLLVYSFT